MELHVIATGSHGNLYLLAHGEDLLMIDPGVDMQTIYRAVDYKLAALQGCLCGHAHLDHSRSLKSLVDAYVDVYASRQTIETLGINTRMPNVNILECGTDAIGRWIVTSFPVEHDAEGSLGFYLTHVDSQENILYLTDTGYCRFNPLRVTSIIIECNYIDDLLVTNGIEDERKLRLSKYHMSLERVLSYLAKIDTSCLRDVVLIHLSDLNSDAERILKAIKNQTGCNVYIADAGMTICLDAIPF